MRLPILLRSGRLIRTSGDFAIKFFAHYIFSLFIPPLPNVLAVSCDRPSISIPLLIQHTATTGYHEFEAHFLVFHLRGFGLIIAMANTATESMNALPVSIKDRVRVSYSFNRQLIYKIYNRRTPSIQPCYKDPFTRRR